MLSVAVILSTSSASAVHENAARSTRIVVYVRHWHYTAYCGTNNPTLFPSVYGGKRRTLRRRKWSTKYKRSINCRKPRGFSQKQHCKYGRRKRKTKIVVLNGK